MIQKNKSNFMSMSTTKSILFSNQPRMISCRKLLVGLNNVNLDYVTILN